MFMDTPPHAFSLFGGFKLRTLKGDLTQAIY